MSHRHKYTAGWVRGQQIFRECVSCHAVHMWYDTNKRPELKRTDYHYYKSMAEYYGI